MHSPKKGLKAILFFSVFFVVLIIILRIGFEDGKTFSLFFLKDNSIFFGIWIIIILFGLTFLFILIRNIIKLYISEERSLKRFSFKKKLVIFFVSFSIVPSLLLFYFASDILNRSVNQWFRAPIEKIMQNAQEVKNNFYYGIGEDLNNFAQLIAQMILQKKMYTSDNYFFLQNRVREKMSEYRLDIINIYLNANEILSVFNPRIPLQEYKNLPVNIVYQGLGGNELLKVDNLRGGDLLRSGISIDINATEKLLVITGRFLPTKSIQALNYINQLGEGYWQKKAIRDPVRNTYLLLFLFITILIIFSSSWLGFYLARGITIPIEKLVNASLEVSRGNLDLQISYEKNDEFKALINQFNQMIAQLKSNQLKIIQKNRLIRQRRDLTEKILDNVSTGIIALNEKEQIVLLNNEAKRIFQLDNLDFYHRQIDEVFKGEAFQELLGYVQEVRKNSQKNFERELDLKIAGKIINISVKISSFRKASPDVSGLLIAVNDLSELIRAQRLLVWREVAQRIAHEIKNPLTPIQISIQRILKSLDQPDEIFRKIAEESIGVINDEFTIIKSLAEEFGNFARLPEMKFVKADLNEILEQLLKAYVAIYPDIQFEKSFDPQLPPMVPVDVDQIKRVFINIIDNAIEALGAKGKITLHTLYRRESNFVEITVADDGPGIPDSEKEKIFLPYFSKKEQGSGLGLAIALNIIEEHRGEILVEDNQPHGARFIINLPA